MTDRAARIDAVLARAEAAVASRNVTELRMAQACLEGSLDWDAKQDTGDLAWVKAAAKSVAETLAEVLG